SVILERLQSVDVIGMIVAGNDEPDFLVGSLLDILQKRPSEAWSSKCVEHDDTVIGDHKARVRGVALVVLAGNSGTSNAIKNIRAWSLFDRQGPIERSVFFLALCIGRLCRQHRSTRHCHDLDKSLHAISSQYSF